MPMMLRKKGKATKIAYMILGTPANMVPAGKKPKPMTYDQKRLQFEETVRVR